MLHSTKSTRSRSAGSRAEFQTISTHMAQSLIGQVVSLRGRANRVLHGIVAGVITETGRPKLVVNRVEYDLNQVLSVTPPVFN